MLQLTLNPHNPAGPLWLCFVTPTSFLFLAEVL